ncbi:hypothetical protein JCM10207_001437, partial [Rhodosporidiobolus poonsookiae]
PRRALRSVFTPLSAVDAFAAHRAACDSYDKRSSSAVPSIVMLATYGTGISWQDRSDMNASTNRPTSAGHRIFRRPPSPPANVRDGQQAVRGSGAEDDVDVGGMRRSLLAVSSAYRTTSLAARQVEANSPPLDLVARRRVFRLALRALSATPTHPLYEPRRLAQARRPRAHPSPLHRALSAFPSILTPSLPVESIVPLPLPPWEPAPVANVVVAALKDEAALTHNTLLAALPSSHLVAYSDGSLLDARAGGGVLVRAVLDGEVSELERGRTLGQYQSVYAAELEGARLALATTIPLVPAGFQAVLLDNQSVLLQPFSPAPSAGQQARLALRTLARHLNKNEPECVLTLLWVPGHVGVDGNERADALAKMAAESRAESGSKRFLDVDDPERLCAACGIPETRQHYLLDCPRYQQQRRRLRRDLNGRPLTLPLLFAPSSTTALLRFIHASERFPRLHATLPAASNA